MNTTLIKIAYVIFLPLVIMLQVAVGLKLRYTPSQNNFNGTPILSLEDSVWGLAGYLAFGMSPAFTYVDAIGDPVIILMRRTCLGVTLHEGGHCHYLPAQPKTRAEAKAGHKGKGARFEHQADKYVVLKLREWGAPKEEFDKYIEFLDGAHGDGPYRARMLRRFIRRYHIV